MREKTVKKRENSRKIYFLVAFLAAGLFLVNLAISNRLATAGAQLETLDGEIEKLKLENLSLEEGIISAGSMASLKQRAKEIGLVDSATVLYLKGEVSMAMK